jgi:DNA-binding MarR family transcriptional regulator
MIALDTSMSASREDKLRQTLKISADRWRAQGWVDSADGMAAIKAVLRVQRLYASRSDELLQQFGINVSRYEVLLRLYFGDHEGVTLGTISHDLQMSPAAVTYMVDRLEADGLLSRTSSPSDRRVTIALLSEAGRSTVIDASQVMNKAVFTSTGLSADELDVLCELTTRLSKSLLPANN